ncbi:hypothetical protein Tco_0963197 [Tanacetum coccineum]
MIQDFTAYQTHFAFATREATLKPKRIYKKTDSPIIKTTTKSSTGSPSKKNIAPAKKDVSLKKPLIKHSTGVQIKDTPGVSVSKKAPVTTDKSKTSGSSEGANFESQVPDEPKGKSTDISEGTSMKLGVPDLSKADSSNSENKSWGDSGGNDDSNNDESDDVSDNEDNDDNGDDDGDNGASDEEKTKFDDDQNNDDK